jgi:hypothetical protein
MMEDCFSFRHLLTTGTEVTRQWPFTETGVSLP